MKNKTLSILLIAAFQGLAIADPNLIVFDPFDDGDRTNGDDPHDTQWWKVGNDATVTVVSGTSAVTDDNFSLVYNTGSTFAGMYGLFPTTTLDAIGTGKEGLRLTFDFRLRSTNSNEAAFRFGLVNQLGTPFTADRVPSVSNTNSDDVGFLVTVPVSIADKFLRIRSDLNATIHGSPASGPLGINGSVATSSPVAFSLNDTLPHSAMLTIVRDGDGTTLSITATIYEEPNLQGAVLSTVTISGYTPTAPSESLFTFDAIAIGVGNQANNFSFDNVKLVQFPGVDPTSDPYADWAATFTGFTDTALLSDPESDGVKNIFEYILGGDPTVSNPTILPQPSLSGSNLTMNFRRRIESIDAGFNLILQVSEVLDDWATATELTIGAASGTGPDGITYTVTVDPMDSAFDLISITVPPGTDPRKFARISATSPSP